MGIRYRANVGRMAAAVVIPAVSPSKATGGACRVVGFPGTLAVPSPGANTPKVPELEAQRFYGSQAARYINPQVYVLAPPYPLRPRVYRGRDRISPVPAVKPQNAVTTTQRAPHRLGSSVLYNPRPLVAWPVRGHPGTYA